MKGWSPFLKSRRDGGDSGGKTLGVGVSKAPAPGERRPGTAEQGIAERLLPPEPLPALTFGSASVVPSPAETSSISDPEEEETRARGNRGKKQRDIRRELEKQAPQF